MFPHSNPGHQMSLHLALVVLMYIGLPISLYQPKYVLLPVYLQPNYDDVLLCTPLAGPFAEELLPRDHSIVILLCFM